MHSKSDVVQSIITQKNRSKIPNTKIQSCQVDVLERRRKKILAKCFHETDEYGWCATCHPDAKKGQPGYCGFGAKEVEAEAPKIDANSTDWGFCNSHCRSQSYLPDILQVRPRNNLIGHPSDNRKKGCHFFPFRRPN